MLQERLVTGGGETSNGEPTDEEAYEQVVRQYVRSMGPMDPTQIEREVAYYMRHKYPNWKPNGQ